MHYTLIHEPLAGGCVVTGIATGSDDKQHIEILSDSRDYYWKKRGAGKRREKELRAGLDILR